MKTKNRHIAKTITWRIIASTTTFVLAMIFFGDDPNATQKAASVAIMESIIKMVLYYYHERVWFAVPSKLRSGVRHLLKTLTWRVIASLTTFILAYLVFKEDQNVVEKASGVAVIEMFLKMLLYYLHERVWYRQDLGLEDRKNVKEQLSHKIDQE